MKAKELHKELIKAFDGNSTISKVKLLWELEYQLCKEQREICADNYYEFLNNGYNPRHNIETAPMPEL